MFAARVILRKNKLFTNFISTSSVLNCKEPKDENVLNRNEPKDENAVNPTESKFKKAEKRNKFKEKNILNFSETKDNNVENNFIKQENKKIRENTQKSLSSDAPGDHILEILKERCFSTVPKKKQKITKDPDKPIKLLGDITENSVKNLAKDLGGDVKKTTVDLLGYLKNLSVSKDASGKTDDEVNDRENEMFPKHYLENMKMFSQFQPLNIFNSSIMNESESQVKLKIWDELEAETLRDDIRTLPINCFEEMIAWTNEGRLWTFPIDNDQGMENEAEVSFTEHIFLDQYLEPWCPKKGPLRKFMQMVLIGLSKNHNYSVKEKKEHIYWFKNYFEEKKKVLQELGAMSVSIETEEPQLEASGATKDP